LGLLYYDTNRLAAAEPLFRRALAIDEQAYGANHPSVAIRLNNLAQLLQATNRLAQAEPLMRRALAIDEQAYGAAHPDVARDLNNLARLLQDTNRLAQAEPLMRRALAIDEQAYGANHPRVATYLNNLAQLLKATNRLAQAEPLYLRALAITEQAYGAAHPTVAICLNNLARLLQDTNRLAQAEPLFRRMVAIFHRFGQHTGHEHPFMQVGLENYRRLLTAWEVPPEDIERRVQAAMQTPGLLEPITPEVERLLGPAQPVQAVLAALDSQYQQDHKPAVWFLPSDQPIVPHLVELLKPDTEFLNTMGVKAYRNGAYAEAVILYEESLKRAAGQPEQAPQAFTIRMNRAAALRELGETAQAHDALQRLLSELPQHAAIPAFTKGLAHYHLALCQWRLGDRAAAQREAEQSLIAYGQVSSQDPRTADMIAESQQLLADLKENKMPPPSPKVDAAAELENARTRFQAREALATLPLDQPIVAHLDKLLGPASSTQEVLDALDRQYREQGKSPVWLLPPGEPLAPRLDELLGPVTEGRAEKG
jgi:tetratricopeptide (TPR) repeat protein